MIGRGAFGAQLNFWRQRMEGADIADVYYPAFLVNGKQKPEYPEFKAGEKLRLRLINGSSSTQFWMTFGGVIPTLVSADGKVVLNYNGEIYNYQSLKQDLIQKGYQFKTTSDTEVLLNAYIAYGKDCLNKLNGFFAFAILDSCTIPTDVQFTNLSQGATGYQWIVDNSGNFITANNPGTSATIKVLDIGIDADKDWFEDFGSSSQSEILKGEKLLVLSFDEQIFDTPLSAQVVAVSKVTPNEFKVGCQFLVA